MAGAAAVDRRRSRTRRASRPAADAAEAADSPDTNYVPYKGPIAPPPAHRALRLPTDDPTSRPAGKKAVAYEDPYADGQPTASADDYRSRAFSAGSVPGGGIGESPVHVRLASSRREGSNSGSSHNSDLFGRPSFSRTAKELSPFLSIGGSGSNAASGTRAHGRPGHHARPPWLSLDSTPSSVSSSDFDAPPHPTRQRSNSTSNLSEHTPPLPAEDVVWDPVPPLVRSRNSPKVNVCSPPARKISEPFLTPIGPAQTFIPSRPVPAPDPHGLVTPDKSTGSRALSPYLRTKPLAALSAPKLGITVPHRTTAKPKRKVTSYEASTFCDTFVYPQPKLKPFLISPPASPVSSSASSFETQPMSNAYSPSRAHGIRASQSLGALASRSRDPDIASETSSFDTGRPPPRLTFEERVRKEGQAREYERAAWARAAKRASVSRSFDAKCRRARSKSLSHLVDKDGRPNEAIGPSAHTSKASPEIPSSFDFLRHEPRTPTKRHAAGSEHRSPLKSAMKFVRRATSIGNLSAPATHDEKQAEVARAPPRVRIVDEKRLPRKSVDAGLAATTGLGLYPSAPSPTASLGSVVDIGRDTVLATTRRESFVKPSPTAAAAAVHEEIGLAISPISEPYDSRPPSSDRHRQPSRAGSVSSIQAFHRRFPSTASAGPGPLPPSASSRSNHRSPAAVREAWKGHTVAQSLDSAVRGAGEQHESLSSRAGRRMSKPPSGRHPTPGDILQDSFSTAFTSSPDNLSTLGHAAVAATVDPADKYTTIPVVRPLSKSSSGSSRGKGMQQTWAFPAASVRQRHLSEGSRSSSLPSSASCRNSARVSDAGTPVPLFVYGGNYDNLFYRPGASPVRSTAAPSPVSSPVRNVNISSISLASSSSDAYPTTSAHASEDDADQTVTISQHQVPALRSAGSVSRHSNLPTSTLNRRRSLVPELGSALFEDSPDSAGSVVHQFPHPPVALADDRRSMQSHHMTDGQSATSHYQTADESHGSESAHSHLY